MHSYRSAANPVSILASTDALIVRAGIHVFWCGTPAGAARQLEGLVRQFVRGVEKDYKRLVAVAADVPEAAVLVADAVAVCDVQV